LVSSLLFILFLFSRDKLRRAPFKNGARPAISEKGTWKNQQIPTAGKSKIKDEERGGNDGAGVD
jgi:hypothetical protein